MLTEHEVADVRFLIFEDRLKGYLFFNPEVHERGVLCWWWSDHLRWCYERNKDSRLCLFKIQN